MINTTKIEQLKCDVGTDIFLELASHFANELEQQIKSLKLVSTENKDGQDSIHDTLHTLKNTASLYGADSLANMASQYYEKDDVNSVEVIELCIEISNSRRDFLKAISLGE